MTVSDASDDRVLFDVDSEKRIATITLNNPRPAQFVRRERCATRSRAIWIASPRTTI